MATPKKLQKLLKQRLEAVQQDNVAPIQVIAESFSSYKSGLKWSILKNFAIVQENVAVELKTSLPVVSEEQALAESKGVVAAIDDPHSVDLLWVLQSCPDTLLLWKPDDLTAALKKVQVYHVQLGGTPTGIYGYTIAHIPVYRFVPKLAKPCLSDV